MTNSSVVIKAGRLQGHCMQMSCRHAHLLGCSLTPKEVFLEAGSRLLKLIQAVLLALNKAVCILCLTQWAEPLTLWDLV